MIRYSLIVFLIICFTRIGAIAQDVSSAPIVDPFSLSKDNLGAISNSVNLFTGDIGLPMSLISIAGRGDADINVTAFYSSANIENDATTWSLDAPTGALGMGWSIPSTQIVVDNNETASREDDVFFLQENNVSTQLICNGISSGVRSFVTKTHSNKIIKYTQATEKWEITLESGTKMIFGFESSAIQWINVWGNWIGNTSIGSMQRQGLVWNLSQVLSIYGDQVNYTYTKEENVVGSNGLTFHTEASYLTKIYDSFGHEINFVYKNKLAEEVVEPNTEQQEPDAFQDRYEKMYLDKIQVKCDGTQFYEVKFQYSFMDMPNGVRKRLLANFLKTATTDGAQSPAISFGYLSSGPMAGALNKIITPYGGTITFDYSSGISITLPNTNIKVDAPAGYSEPRLFSESDYTILTWRKLNAGSHDTGVEPIEILAYTWDGEWRSTSLTKDMPYNLIKHNNLNASQNFAVETSTDFFAMLYQDYSNTGYSYLNIWRRDPKKNGAWMSFSEHISFGSSADASKYKLLCGENFVAVADNKGHINRYLWNGEVWYSSAVTETSGTNFVYAANNYIISHRTDTNPDQITFYYLDAIKNWSNPISISSPVNNGSSDPVWALNKSCAALISDDNNLHFYHWNDTYTSFSRIDKGLQSYSPAYFSQTTLGLINETTSKTYRFNGSDWIVSTTGSSNSQFPGNNLITSFGEDSFFWGTPYSLSFFKPNIGSWTAPTILASQSILSSLVNGVLYYLLNGQFIYDFPNGVAVPEGFSASGVSVQSTPSRLFFVSHTIEDPTGSVYFIKNGKLFNVTPLSVFAPYSVMNGSLGENAIHLASSNTVNFFDCTTMMFARIASASKSIGTFTDYPVVKMTVNDGLKNYYTSYVYQPSTAITDVTRTNAQYNKVTTIQGSESVSTKPFGYTVNYFFNGTSDQELASISGNLIAPTNSSESFPKQNVTSVNPGCYPCNSSTASLNYGALTGRIYRTQLFDSGDNLVSESDFSYAVVNNNLDDGVKFIDMNYQVLLAGVNKTEDGITRSTDYIYNSFGQKSHSKSYTGTGTEVLDVYYTYGWEVYPTSLKAMNILSPIFQVRESLNGQDILSSVTRYDENFTCVNCSGVVPVKYETYSWHGTSTASQPPSSIASTPSTDWVLESRISKRDPNNGLEKEIAYKGGQLRSQLWNSSGRNIVASFFNATAANIAYTSFEDTNNGNFTWSDGIIVSGSSRTGNKYFNLGTGGINVAGLSSTENYIISFWSNSSGGSINISGISGVQNLGNFTGWNYFQFQVSNISNVKITPSGSTTIAVDEISVRPYSSILETSTFHPLFGKTAETNVNGQTSYFLYDGLGRLINVADEKNNILKNIIYNYQK